ncbi:sulfonate/nitrate/taurine ABC transporter extracellular binding protein [Gracilibacillus halophilus YIM-C55.5]|uniref:Sulfonate/nitrate/taurine ABC transporter extracellular binding protein n=1 Tax=Gracilibacillus halophilus YIM-C55.5 TaxID=1308866 RepID=N4WBZ9_9BACI|nr:aliphatic sulfonate ABC transporter substrate-binding protein [Gracilibacillus halophilus]ENH96784.1 sulfonate/nitrate/taurine ABC transporter extracellular binding protein [Gracilibacillus halophilus YIM-C55.5]
MKKAIILFVLSLTLGLLTACGNNSSSAETGQTVRIGYFPNINHVPAMVAKAEGFYQEQLGDDITIKYQTFADGGAFMNALKTGEIEAGLVGPGPAMNHYSNGTDVKIIGAGSTGGTVIMARNGSNIENLEDIKGKTFITPRVGCTHDVQFETYMKENGITSERIGGEMVHTTGKPATYESMFESGKVDVAVAPEPWASVLQLEADAEPIIDETEVSFGTTLPASVLATSGDLIEENPELVQSIVDAHKQATTYINENPEEAKTLAINEIAEVTGQELSKEVMDLAWDNIGFTYKVDAETIQAFGDSSYDLEFLKEEPDFSDLIDTQFIEE